MAIPEKALSLLRAFSDIVEADVVADRNGLFEQNQPDVLFSLEPNFVTDKPDTPILQITGNSQGRLQWRQQLLASYVPHLGWFYRYDDHPLLAQVVNELRPVLLEYPVSAGEEGQYYLDKATEAMPAYIYMTLRLYLALLFRWPYNRDHVFSIAVDALDARISPQRAGHYAGCYLYNLGVLPTEILPCKLDDHFEIRLSTLTDVANQAQFDSVEGKFLPPAHLLTFRRRPSLPIFNAISAVAYVDMPPFDDMIIALRLHKRSYIGRGQSLSWVSGLPMSLGYGSVTEDSFIRKVISGDPPNIPKYQLQASDLEKVVSIYQELQQYSKRPKLETAFARFNASYKSLDYREQIIDLVIALENLFGEETVGQTSEVGYRLRMRAARYLGVSGDERKQIRKFVSDLYTLRSKIVHGDVGATEESAQRVFRKTLAEVADEAQELVRRALLKMLANPSQMGQEYFNDLLLGIAES